MRQIIIAQRGWVFVGDVTRSGDDVTINDAQCIRRWGTTKGLGQLATEGPTRNTVLDPTGSRRAQVLRINELRARRGPKAA